MAAVSESGRAVGAEASSAQPLAGLPQQLAKAQVPAPDWLQPLRDSGRALLGNALWPNRKTEHWKYTSLRLVEQGGFFDRPEWTATEAPTDRDTHWAIADLPTHRLVFVDGIFHAPWSDLAALPAGVTLVRFAQANAAQQAAIQQYLGSVVDLDQHLFAAINNRLLIDGVFLQLADGVVLDKPLQVVCLTRRQAQAYQVPQRLLVVLGEQARATVIEQFVSDDGIQNALVHSVTELVLGAGAHCEHYRLHLEEEHIVHLGGVHVALDRNAQLQGFHLALGGALKRIDLVVNHNGEGGDCVLDGVYLPRNRQHIDYHTCIEHRVPRCTSRETFRGIIGDSASAVFNGRIHIHPQAQKTLARLSNKNLLTSDKAEVNTKPELEIYADDVQCSHGATVAQLDENVLHYFRTRGISRSEAEVMLSFGFINELVNAVATPQIADHLRPVLAGFFARNPQLIRHIL